MADIAEQEVIRVCYDKLVLYTRYWVLVLVIGEEVGIHGIQYIHNEQISVSCGVEGGGYRGCIVYSTVDDMHDRTIGQRVEGLVNKHPSSPCPSIYPAIFIYNLSI